MALLTWIPDWVIIPYSYSPFDSLHLFFLLIIMPLAIIFAWKFRGLSEKTNRKMLLLFTLVFIWIDAFRQVYSSLITEGGHYAWWTFPFHLSSMPLYLCALLLVLKRSRFTRALYGWLAAFGTLGGFMALLIPQYMVSDNLLQTIHSYTWHSMMLFLGFYAGFSKRTGKRFRDYVDVMLLLLLMCLIALGINFTVNKNFGQHINLFFIGPEISPIMVFQDVAKAYGWQINALFYYFMLSLGGYLCWFGVTLPARREASQEISGHQAQ